MFITYHDALRAVVVERRPVQRERAQPGAALPELRQGAHAGLDEALHEGPELFRLDALGWLKLA